MKTAFATGFKSYLPTVSLLYPYSRENDMWIESSILPATSYTIVVSAITRLAKEVLSAVIPVAQKHGVAFKVIRNEFYHYQINGGHFGEELIGKFIELYPVDHRCAQKLTSELLPVTNSFYGPVVRNYKQLNESLFISNSITHTQSAEYTPSYSRLLNRKYFVFGSIHKAPKGDIKLAVARNGFRFSTVVVKQGRKYMFDDDHGRDVQDRLHWEYSVLQRLSDKVRVPKPIDIFKDRDGINLVLEFMAGKNLYHYVTAVFQNQKLSWQTLEAKKKKEVLATYLKSVQIVRQLHSYGIVHRDLNLKNFLLESSGNLALIDFELAYDLQSNIPDPAFIIGMPGFVCPEQKSFAVPTIAEDIYSLGALLFYMLTCHHPINLENGSIGNSAEVMGKAGVSSNLINLVTTTMHSLPELRMSLHKVVSVIQSEIDQL